MKKIKILFVMIGVFLLVGATGCEKLKGSKKEVGRETEYYGKEGLVVDFIDGMPPENVWRGISFDVGLDVQNKGLLDVEKGLVCFGSLSQGTFGKTDGCKDLVEEAELAGRLNFPDGEIRSYVWEEGYELTEDYKSYNEDVDYPLLAKVCYSGETRAGPIVCIKSGGRDMESVCEGGDIQLGDGGKGQGAPVAITDVYEDIIPKKGGGADLRFEIGLANVGDGEVISLKALGGREDCNFMDRKDKNKVNLVEAELVGYGPLECTRDVIPLDQGGKGMILCTKHVDVESGESFPLPLNIKLNYGYLSTTKGGFTIKKDVYEEA